MINPGKRKMVFKQDETRNQTQGSDTASINPLLSTQKSFPSSLNLSYLSYLLDNLPGIAFVCRNDPETTIEYISMGSVQLLGYTPQSLLKERAFTKIVHHGDRANNKSAMDSLTPENSSYTITYRIRKANGEDRWVNEQAQGLYNNQGELLVVVGLITDIQGQKQIEYRLIEENRRLKASIKERGGLVDLVGRSTGMQKIYDLILKAAESNRPVAVMGESGTGKELAAMAIHELSAEREAPFVAVNCGAIPENLFESEFFGHKKGSFSGAHQDKQGYLELANEGSLFLDEVGEMPLHMQVKLLRALDGNGFTIVGGGKTRFSKFRLITATNRDLYEMVELKKMRQDFFYRIHVLPLPMPPLRDRIEDIPILIDHFLNKWFGEGKVPTIPDTIILRLMNHTWPGNVRELENVISRYITFNRLKFTNFRVDEEQNLLQVPKTIARKSNDNLTGIMDQVEKQVIQETLNKYSWRMSETARNLGVNIRTLQRKLKKHSLR